MSILRIVQAYLSLHLLILVGAAVIGAAVTLIFRTRTSARNTLLIHCRCIGIVFFAWLIQPLFPANQGFSPPLKIWGAPSVTVFNSYDVKIKPMGYLQVASSAPPVPVHPFQIGVWMLLIGWVAFSVGTWARDILNIFRARKGALRVRSLGRVRIWVSETIVSPYSLWWLGRAHVVLPPWAAEDADFYRAAVAHEIQHHRQRDTLWVYLERGLLSLAGFNPVLRIWLRKVSELQELACDEALFQRQRFKVSAYAKCVLRAAEYSINASSSAMAPTVARGLARVGTRDGGQLMKRRIELMIKNTQEQFKNSSPVSGRWIVLVFALVLGGTSYAARELIQDRRMSLNQALALAEKAKAPGGFPVVVNDRVLKQLNRLVGTPEGRTMMRESLGRMHALSDVVDSAMKKYPVPVELRALPITESGYKNLSEKESGSPMRAAGVWQFIPVTARNFGLKVDAKRDERLDISRETDAAMRLLLANQLKFMDWSLAVMAYNMGDNAVQRGIDATGSRDAWILIERGHETDKDYLAKFVAAIIIMKNPTILD